MVSFDDVKIIGLTTTLIDYKLAFAINEKLGIRLVRYKDILSYDENPYPFFHYDCGENDNAYNLISINENGKNWIKFPIQTDFLFVIRNFITEDALNEKIAAIRSIPYISYAYEIDLNSNNDIGEVLECIELHEMNIFSGND